MDTIIIKGVEYVSFSIERADMGGRMSKKESLQELKTRGIKYNLSRAYTPFVGHWAVLIEKSREKEAEELFFG